MKKQDIILIILFFICILIEITLLFLLPAYLSNSRSIGKETFIDKYINISVAGVSYSNGTIDVYNNSTITLRHELCHRDYNNSGIHLWKNYHVILNNGLYGERLI